MGNVRMDRGVPVLDITFEGDPPAMEPGLSSVFLQEQTIFFLRLGYRSYWQKKLRPRPDDEQKQSAQAALYHRAFDEGFLRAELDDLMGRGPQEAIHTAGVSDQLPGLIERLRQASDAQNELSGLKVLYQNLQDQLAEEKTSIRRARLLMQVQLLAQACSAMVAEETASESPRGALLAGGLTEEQATELFAALQKSASGFAARSEKSVWETAAPWLLGGALISMVAPLAYGLYRGLGAEEEG